MRKIILVTSVIVSILCFAFVLEGFSNNLGNANAVNIEEKGVERSYSTSGQIHKNLPTRTEVLRKLRDSGLLLIPDSNEDRVMAFDAVTGNLVTTEFIPTDTTNLMLPVQAILSSEGNSILVSDQNKDLIQEYDLEGNYLGYFAPASGINPDILDNIRGICLRPNGNLLASVGSGANTGFIPQFDSLGNYLGNFIEINPGGDGNAFDVIYRTDENDYLVADIENPDFIRRYSSDGNFLDIFTDYVNFPEQIAVASNGNVLVGCFSSPKGVHEYTSEGDLIDVYEPLGTGYYRGVYELPNGNILTAVSTGVYEIDRENNLVDTKISDVNARFISFIQLPDFSPEADFSANILEGQAPLIVEFTDLSVPEDSLILWEWDFDFDGIIDSYNQNPVWMYTSVGTYTVSLKVIANNDSSDTEIKTDFINVTGIGTDEQENAIPENMNLLQNFPNPFKSSTSIIYALNKSGYTKIGFYNLQGKLIRNLDLGMIGPGKFSVEWNGKNQEGTKLKSGIYFYQLVFNDQVQDIRKCVIIR